RGAAMSGEWKSGGDGGWKSSGGVEGGFTEVTHTSFGSRVKGAIAGVLIGLALVPGSAWLLFVNEGRAVQTARSLSEGAGAVQAAEAGRVDPAMEGRLVHVAGPVTVAAPLRDPDFPVQAADAVRLVRSVEMYQWREERRSETRTNLGGSQDTVTTYTYTRGWSPEQIDSSRFRQPDGRVNPQMRFAARDTVAPGARLGARRLTEAQLRGFGETQPIVLDAAVFQPPPGARVVDGGLFVGRDPGNPQIGDLRIRFAQVPAGQASIIARQAGDGFAAYQTRAGDTLLMLRPGNVTAGEMFQSAEQTNTVITWLLRGFGALLMFIAFGLILRPMSVVGSVVPFIGSIVGVGTSLVSLMLTLMLAPVVIAVAWIWYRPVVGVIVLAVGLAAAFGVSRLVARRRAAAMQRPVAA
ncbi:MAG TPA: TMEM43 family protein, partial [Roseomonas sp.]|nr:TMEM43 family protein [Roseomonas sp.]